MHWVRAFRLAVALLGASSAAASTACSNHWKTEEPFRMQQGIEARLAFAPQKGEGYQIWVTVPYNSITMSWALQVRFNWIIAERGIPISSSVGIDLNPHFTVFGSRAGWLVTGFVASSDAPHAALLAVEATLPGYEEVKCHLEVWHYEPQFP